ncbi:hypothetical protein CVT24_002466 [Panaeolus cyanescens]|uniref:F-box domain-containing protein n=1 Tax=Panaeolus cyanescens TaxID=181874 RepID=A0A409WV84_9AGAR|nr:hypothetical protein CVT24_002466 [Panaeolus cyanescens]
MWNALKRALHKKLRSLRILKSRWIGKLKNGPVFSLEIFELILDCLAEDVDTQTLHTCSLVCKAFVEPSQRLLFRTLIIWDWDLPPAVLFEEFVRKNEKVVGYITHMDYTVGRMCSSGRGLSSQNEQHTIQSLLLLPNLQNLCIRNQDSSKSPGFVYDNLFRHYLSTGRLTTLSLSTLDNVPILTILSSPTLQRFTTKFCKFKLDGTTLIEPSGGCGLVHLDMTGYTIPVAAVLSCKQLRYLRLSSIVLQSHPTHSSIFTPLSPSSLSSIETLGLDGNVNLADLYNDAKRERVQVFPNVKHLTITTRDDSFDNTHVVSQALSHIRSLESFELDRAQETPPRIANGNLTPLIPIEEFLQNLPNHTASLRKLVFTMQSYGYARNNQLVDILSL